VDHARLIRMARRQHGLFTRRQAKQAGFSPYQIRRRVAAGEWYRIVGPVLSTNADPGDAARRDLAFHLAVPGSVLAGPSAARRWGIPCLDQGSYLYVGAHGGPRISGVRLLYESPGAREVALSDAARVTTRPVTVFDCLRLLPQTQAVGLLESMLQRGLVTMDEIASVARSRVGRRGTPMAVQALRLVADGSRSAAERVAARLLRSIGISGWALNRPIYDDAGLIGVGDIVFKAVKLVVELDGWAYHVTPEAFQRDRRRQNRLIAAGWTVLRFTWQDLTQHPAYVLNEIRASVARLAA
jgi:very-short-patch-repair endonuclease